MGSWPRGGLSGRHPKLSDGLHTSLQTWVLSWRSFSLIPVGLGFSLDAHCLCLLLETHLRNKEPRIHACNASTHETEAGGSLVRGQPGLRGEPHRKRTLVWSCSSQLSRLRSLRSVGICPFSACSHAWVAFLCNVVKWSWVKAPSGL